MHPELPYSTSKEVHQSLTKNGITRISHRLTNWPVFKPLPPYTLHEQTHHMAVGLWWTPAELSCIDRRVFVSVIDRHVHFKWGALGEDLFVCELLWSRMSANHSVDSRITAISAGLHVCLNNTLKFDNELL